MTAVTDQGTLAPPPLVGLCPGEHLGAFYMPLTDGDSTVCPMCDREMVVYAPCAQQPGRADERIVALLAEASALLDAVAAQPSSPQRQGVIGALRVQLRQPVEASALLLRPPVPGGQGA